MSDRRYTLRASRPIRADSRHTVRVTREQVGGAGTADRAAARAAAKAIREAAEAAAAAAKAAAEARVAAEPTGLYVIPPERQNNWNKALDAQPPLRKYATIITREDWGTLTPELKLKTYIELIERQDDLFLTAVSIIYNELGIKPDSENLEQSVFDILDKTSLDRQAELKEYLSDVYRLVTCIEPIRTLGGVAKYKFIKQTRLLINDPLSHILLRPKRATNVFISCIAKILISLKKTPALLIKSSQEKADLQAMFADVYNTFIQHEILDATSKSLRDGYFLWQEVQAGVVPPDECGINTTTQCDEKKSNTLLWQNFCKYYSTIGDTALFGSVVSSTGGILKTMFSRILVDIFKMYKHKTADQIRTDYIAQFYNTLESKPNTISSIYRPAIVDRLNTIEAGMMRMLDPEQYTFIFHLLYTLTKLEAAEASTTSMDEASD